MFCSICTCFRLEYLRFFKCIVFIFRNFSSVGQKFPGIRVLRQDPTETLLSFLCSVNNAIYRIVPMIDRMCQKFGKKVK